jgi:hypothetical protein
MVLFRSNKVGLSFLIALAFAFYVDCSPMKKALTSMMSGKGKTHKAARGESSHVQEHNVESNQGGHHRRSSSNLSNKSMQEEGTVYYDDYHSFAEYSTHHSLEPTPAHAYYHSDGWSRTAPSYQRAKEEQMTSAMADLNVHEHQHQRQGEQSHQLSEAHISEIQSMVNRVRQASVYSTNNRGSRRSRTYRGNLPPPRYI